MIHDGRRGRHSGEDEENAARGGRSVGERIESSGRALLCKPLSVSVLSPRHGFPHARARNFGADEERRRESEMPIEETFARRRRGDLVHNGSWKERQIKPLSSGTCLHHEPNAQNMNNKAKITHVCKLV